MSNQIEELDELLLRVGLSCEAVGDAVAALEDAVAAASDAAEAVKESDREAYAAWERGRHYEIVKLKNITKTVRKNEGQAAPKGHWRWMLEQLGVLVSATKRRVKKPRLKKMSATSIINSAAAGINRPGTVVTDLDVASLERLLDEARKKATPADLVMPVPSAEDYDE